MQVFITFYGVVAELERYMCVVGWHRQGGCTETFGLVLYVGSCWITAVTERALDSSRAHRSFSGVAMVATTACMMTTISLRLRASRP